MKTNIKTDQQPKRRAMLKAAAAGGAAVALSGALSGFEALAVSGDTGVKTVPNVAALLQLTTLADGDKVYVAGYYNEGDGGAKLVRWNAASTKADNGGTVHKHGSYSVGRFETMHDGTADYRWFGIFDETVTADAAFDAMAGDTSILKIIAKTNLLFRKRHKIYRSNLTLDFCNNAVYTNGIEDATANREEWSAVFYFGGTVTGNSISRVLASEITEYNDIYELPYNSNLTVGDWYSVKCSKGAEYSGTSAFELQKMMRVTERYASSSSTGDRYRFDYEGGYTIPAGRTVTYQKVVPITDISVCNMRFYGSGKGLAGCHPVTFEYAVRANVSNIHCSGTYCAAVMRFYCTHYITEDSSLVNPPDIETGGRGYFTQQLYCLYGTVRRCRTSNARHLNDFTSCGYMKVENCTAINSAYSGFTTHGQFEHDLTYLNNAGTIAFAGSGETWGGSAKNIVVKKQVGEHIGGWLRTTNLTLEDCTAVANYNANPNLVEFKNGTIMANCDGLIMKNCTASNMFYLLANSTKAVRPNVIENCDFKLLNAESGTTQLPYLTSLTPRITKPLTFKNCRFSNMTSNFFFNNAPVNFESCTFQGEGSTYGMDFRSYLVSFKNCRFIDVGLVLRSNAADEQAAVEAGSVYGINGMQRCIMRDCEFIGTFAPGAVTIHYSATMPVMLEFDGTRYAQGGKMIVQGVAAKLAGLKIMNSTILSGTTALIASPMYQDGHVIITGNYIESHTFSNLPSTKKTAGNFTVSAAGL